MTTAGKCVLCIFPHLGQLMTDAALPEKPTISDLSKLIGNVHPQSHLIAVYPTIEPSYCQNILPRFCPFAFPTLCGILCDRIGDRETPAKSANRLFNNLPAFQSARINR